MKKLIILLLIPVILLSGCYDSKEVDNTAYVIAVGIDNGQEKGLRFTMQFAVPLNIGGGVETAFKGESDKGAIKNISVEADSLYTALDFVNNIVSKDINTTHCKLLIFSDELAKSKGLNQFSNALLNARYFRPGCYAATSKGKAEDYLNNISSPLELNPTSYYELIFDKKFSAFAPTTYIQDIVNHQELGDIETVMPLTIVRDKQSLINGMAIYKNNFLVGTCEGEETLIYKILSGTFDHAHYPVENSDNLVFSLAQKSKPAIYAEITGDKSKAVFKIELVGEVVSAKENQNANRDTAEQLLIAQIKKQSLEFLSKTAQEYNSDIFGVGKRLKSNFRTIEDWNNYKWKDKYKDCEFDVDIVFNFESVE